MPEKTKKCLVTMKEVQKEAASGDIKCAEIKSIPSMVQKHVFKLGEYNRATASFEMNSNPDLSHVAFAHDAEMQAGKIEFDLTPQDTPSHYFKSSFARSMMINTSKSKSLDYSAVNRNGLTVKEEQGQASLWQVPGKENWDLRSVQQPVDFQDDGSTSSSTSFHSDKPVNMKKSDVIEEHHKHQPSLLERPGSRCSTSYQRSLSGFSDVMLRSPLTASCRSSYNRSHSSASDVDAVMLQSQVTTLQWQLRQAEASRQMHRAVLEQVVSFLQRTHKNLDVLQARIHDQDSVSTVTRVPRSRSAHGGDSSPSRLSSPRSESNLSFHKAKSIAQMGDPDCPKHGSAFRDTAWRRARKQHYDPEDLSPSKLSEEAFRLLRTVQSLLSTREPDLTTRLSSGLCDVGSEGSSSPPGGRADASSASSTVSAALDSATEDNSSDLSNFQSQETLRNSSLPTSRSMDKDLSLQSAFGGNCSPIPGLSAAHLKDATMSLGRRRRYRTLSDSKGSPPQLSISSADDESGFSSLNSFQEVGVPMPYTPRNGDARHKCQIIPEEKRLEHGFRSNGKGKYEEIGLPMLPVVPRADEASCKIHRRWSSTPADNPVMKLRPGSLCVSGDPIRVLWV